ncbi:uncharacterized protein LOC141596896 [Silene latifolia]|uniref:uncharacterized protein LOC141596896 n=1 Tax=Silene latifolia TaxID=37657 RepID=UPI003D77A97C
MEVRGCSQVHFISVIQGGEVIKMHNVTRGKSVLKLKNIEQIYVADASECQESLPRYPPKVNRFLAMTNGVDVAKAQVKTEFTEEGNELDFGTITLKQLRQTCKSKKRKAPMPVIMAAVKQEVCEEDELELEETLFSWKKKVLKKAKSKKKKKKKRTSNSGSASSEIDDFGCVLMDTPSSLALVDISSEVYNPSQIKVEDYEPYYEQPQAISFILSEDHQNSTCEMSASSECCSSDQALESNSLQLTSVDRQNCVLNQISYELTDHTEYDLIMPQTSSFEEVLMIEGSDSPRKEDMSDPLTCDESPDECDSFAFQDYNAHSVDGDAATSDENLLLLESPCTGEETQSDDSWKSKDVSMHIETSCAASLLSTTFVVDDRGSSVDNYVDPLSCSPVVQSSNAIEEPAVSAAIEGNGNSMTPHPPERLLSARKIISPTSQEKLRKAMNSDEEQVDAEIHSCKGKLLFEKNEPKFFSSRDVKGAGIDSSSKRQRMRKGKYEGRFPHSRGSVNGTQAAQGSQNVDNICSVQMCSQKAIAFSKQQVHDIERIATKLVSGLRSMKSIVVDALQHESRTGTKSKYNTDEVRLAVENAGKVEETAQRWLAIMSRDCNRFCKIMSLAEADASSPEKTKEENPSSPETKTIPKERKIMFADEAGGNLCNIKVFKNINTGMDLDTPTKRLCTRTES